MHTEKLAAVADLRRQMARLERRANIPQAPSLAFGIDSQDACLGGGLEQGALHEIGGPAALAFAAMLTARANDEFGDETLWVAERDSLERLYPLGMAEFSLFPSYFLYVEAPPGDALWALEQALQGGAHRWVVASAPAPDFAESRRLQLAARENGATALLLPSRRAAGAGPASAAVTRWRVSPHPSGPANTPVFCLELLKNKKGLNGAWTITWNRSERRLRLAAKPRDRSDRAAPSHCAG